MSVGAQVVFAYQSLLARIIRTFVLVIKRTKGKEKSSLPNQVGALEF